MGSGPSALREVYSESPPVMQPEQGKLEPGRRPASLSPLTAVLGFVVFASWLALFAGGILVDTRPYRMRVSPDGVAALEAEARLGRDDGGTQGQTPADKSQPDARASDSAPGAGASGQTASDRQAARGSLLAAWGVVMMCFLPLNLAWLCVASSTLGALGSEANLSDDESSAASRDTSNPVRLGAAARILRLSLHDVRAVGARQRAVFQCRTRSIHQARGVPVALQLRHQLSPASVQRAGGGGPAAHSPGAGSRRCESTIRGEVRNGTRDRRRGGRKTNHGDAVASGGLDGARLSRTIRAGSPPLERTCRERGAVANRRGHVVPLSASRGGAAGAGPDLSPANPRDRVSRSRAAGTLHPDPQGARRGACRDCRAHPERMGPHDQ